MAQVKFNVGGRIFETSRATIMSISDTLLSNMISDIPKDDSEQKFCSGNSTIFIDRNPEVFSVVLDLYRHKRLINHKSIDTDFLRSELEFYGLDDFVYGQPSVPIVPPMTYRRWQFHENKNHNNDFQNAHMIIIYPDVQKAIGVTLDQNDTLSLISELRVNSGVVTILNLTLLGITSSSDASSHQYLYSELCHFLECSSIKLNIKNGSKFHTSWYPMIVKALKNTSLSEFSVDIDLDTDSAHKICDQMGSGHYRSKKIVLRGVTNVPAKNLLARRPFELM